MSSLLVIPFAKDACPFSNRDHSWQQFHGFRNAVLDVLSSYGSAGPMAKFPIRETYEESREAWRSTTDDPDFFVVTDDIYGMSVRVEADCVLIKARLLEELAMLLMQFPDWCVYLAVVKGGLWVFRDRLLFEGEFFSGCGSI